MAKPASTANSGTRHKQRSITATMATDKAVKKTVVEKSGMHINAKKNANEAESPPKTAIQNKKIQTNQMSCGKLRAHAIQAACWPASQQASQSANPKIFFFLQPSGSKSTTTMLLCISPKFRRLRAHLGLCQSFSHKLTTQLKARFIKRLVMTARYSHFLPQANPNFTKL